VSTVIDIPILHSRIVDWLSPLLDEGVAEPPTKLVLRHLPEAARASLVATIPIKDDSDASAVDALARRIFGAVTADAEGLGGPQRYEALAYRRDDPEDLLLARLMVLVPPQEGAMPLALASPDQSGVLQMLMQYNLELTRLSSVATHTVIGTLQRQLSHQAALADSADRARLRYTEASERMLSEETERLLSAEVARHSMALKEVSVEKLLSALSMAAPYFAKLASQAPPPPAQPSQDSPPPSAESAPPLKSPESSGGSSDVVVPLLRQLVGSLQQSQHPALLQILTPDQQGTLAQIISALEPQGVSD